MLLTMCLVLVLALGSDSLHHVLHHHHLPSANTKEPIVVLHGLLGSSRNLMSWAKILHNKLNNQHDIYLLDLRNHGQSTKLGPLLMEYNLMAGDVIATLDALSIKSFHMVGHSLGGKVAGATSLKYSDRVKSLVFLDISPIKYDKTSDVFKEVIHTVDFLVSSKSKISESSSKKEVQELISSTITDEAMTSFLLSNIQGAVTPIQTIPDDVCLPSSKLGFEWKFLVDGINMSMDNIADFPFTSNQYVYKKPCLVYKAGNSLFVRPHHLEQIKLLFPSYNYVQEKGSHHWMHISHPEESTSKLINFYNFVYNEM